MVEGVSGHVHAHVHKVYNFNLVEPMGIALPLDTDI